MLEVAVETVRVQKGLKRVSRLIEDEAERSKVVGGVRGLVEGQEGAHEVVEEQFQMVR